MSTRSHGESLLPIQGRRPLVARRAVNPATLLHPKAAPLAPSGRSCHPVRRADDSPEAPSVDFKFRAAERGRFSNDAEETNGFLEPWPMRRRGPQLGEQGRHADPGLLVVAVVRVQTEG